MKMGENIVGGARTRIGEESEKLGVVAPIVRDIVTRRRSAIITTRRNQRAPRKRREERNMVQRKCLPQGNTTRVRRLKWSQRATEVQAPMTRMPSEDQWLHMMIFHQHRLQITTTTDITTGEVPTGKTPMTTDDPHPQIIDTHHQMATDGPDTLARLRHIDIADVEPLLPIT